MANAIAIDAPIMAYWHRDFTDPDFQCTLLPAMLKDKMRMLLPLYHEANPQRNVILAQCCFATALSSTPAWLLAVPLVQRIATQVKDPLLCNLVQPSRMAVLDGNSWYPGRQRWHDPLTRSVPECERIALERERASGTCLSLHEHI